MATPNEEISLARFAAILENPERLRAIQQAAMLDTPPEEEFDRLTRMAAKILEAPVALVSIVDGNRQFFKSCIGLPQSLADARQTPLSHSFCKHVVVTGEPLIVSDAREHPILKQNPVIVMGVIAYAGIPLVTPDGVAMGSLCVIDSVPRHWTPQQIDLLRDIAAITVNEIELRRTNEKLISACAAKDRFMAMLSHDLRTPLSPALMIADSLANNPDLSQSVRDDAQMIHRNIAMEVSMIDSLLDAAHIANGKLRLQTTDADVHEILHASRAVCLGEASARSISIDLDLAATRTMVTADPGKLQQVFCNLLKNAIKFSAPGGAVLIRSTDERQESLRLEVVDAGIGIPPELLPHIFTPFEQGTSRAGGMGLGLAIAQGIVEAHHGFITASSEGKDKGATIAVVLPGACINRIAAPRNGGAKPKSLQPLTILLIEDHVDSLRAMKQLLNGLKYQVTAVGTAHDALAAAATRTFDLVICDLGLPDASGLQLMPALHAAGSRTGIALTGYGMESDIHDTRAAGFQRHLTKPVTMDKLVAAINDITQSH